MKQCSMIDGGSLAKAETLTEALPYLQRYAGNTLSSNMAACNGRRLACTVISLTMSCC